MLLLMLAVFSCFFVHANVHFYTRQNAFQLRYLSANACCVNICQVKQPETTRNCFNISPLDENETLCFISHYYHHYFYILFCFINEPRKQNTQPIFFFSSSLLPKVTNISFHLFHCTNIIVIIIIIILCSSIFCASFFCCCW